MSLPLWPGLESRFGTRLNPWRCRDVGIFSKPSFFHPPRAGRFEALNHVPELFPERARGGGLRLAKNLVTRKPLELRCPGSERSQGRSLAICPAVRASGGQAIRSGWPGRHSVDFGGGWHPRENFPGLRPGQAGWASVPPGLCSNRGSVGLTVFPWCPFQFAPWPGEFSGFFFMAPSVRAASLDPLNQVLERGNFHGQFPGPKIQYF